jgi:RNA recognition motif-containing protein
MGWNMQNDQQQYINPMSISFVVQPEYIEHDWRTTLMIRNIPNKYTVNELADEIDTEHANTYDFLYLPCDPKVKYIIIQNQCNVGYGFINFVDTKYLLNFYQKYNKYIWQKYKSEKVIL